MYSLVENVIKNSNYNLTEIIRKIDVLWVDDQLTDEERNALLSLARGGAKTENTVDVIAKLNDLENRVRELENGGSIPKEDIEEYQDGKWYYKGDKCSFEGANYICVAPDGVVCVWSPSAYPQYWEKA
jgi:hypothetical protein